MYYPIFLRTNKNFATTSGTSYLGIAGTNQDLWTTTEASSLHSVPTAMNLTNMYVKSVRPPGLNRSVVYTVRKNGADTGLTVTLSDLTETGSSDTLVSFAAGDTISFAAVPTSTADNPSFLYVTFLASGTSQNIFVSNTAGGGSVPSNSATEYSSILGGGLNNWVTAEAIPSNPAPAAGTLSNLYINVDTAPGGATSYALKVRKAGADTTLVATLSGANIVVSDTTHSVSIAAGDVIGISSTPATTPVVPGAMNVSLAFTPTTAGDSIFGFNIGSGGASSSVANYGLPFGPISGSLDVAADESNDYVQPGPCIIKSFYANLETAPGGAASWVMTLRKNRVDTSHTVTVSAAGTTGSASATLAMSQGDMLSFSTTPSGTPAATRHRFGYCINFQGNSGLLMPL